MTKQKQLLIRNTHDGMIWQVYNISDQREINILERNARANGFQSFEIVSSADPYEETFPGWRDSIGWQKIVQTELQSK